MPSIFQILFSSALPVLLGGGYACSIMGLGIMALAIGYALSPLIMGLLVQNHVSSFSWVSSLISKKNLVCRFFSNNFLKDKWSEIDWKKKKKKSKKKKTEKILKIKWKTWKKLFLENESKNELRKIEVEQRNGKKKWW